MELAKLLELVVDGTPAPESAALKVRQNRHCGRVVAIAHLAYKGLFTVVSDRQYSVVCKL